MSESEIQAHSLVIKKSLLKLDVYKKVSTIVFYASFRSEVDTFPMIRNALKDGKTVGLPIAKAGGKLKIKAVSNLEDLTKSNLGIPEPSEGLSDISVEQIDVVIVPGCCFDKRGFRLGYGGGYYDRFLKSLPQGVIKIGLAFDCQLVDEILCEEYDQPVDMLITEKAVYQFK